MSMYEAIVVGVSAGGMRALSKLMPILPSDLASPVIVVQHTAPNSGGYLSTHLNELSQIQVKEAIDKEPVSGGTVYLAPAGYHLLIEEGRTFALSVDPPVNYARPSIDVLFESAADVYDNRLIGIILTGANADGSEGLKRIKERGGLTVVQDPSTAEVACMPQAAVATTEVDHVLDIDDIGPFLIQLDGD